MATIHTANNEDIIVATQNQDSLLAFSKKNNPAASKWITLKPDDFCADIIYKDGGKRRVEFYYGSTYLSQSSRKFPVDKNFAKVIITNFRGSKREVL